MSFTEFTFEGDSVLGYFTAEVDDRHVRIKSDTDSAESVGQRVEQIIARSLNFPSDQEFEDFFAKMETLRDQDLQPADGLPDIIREGTRLKITVEVMNGEDDD